MSIYIITHKKFKQPNAEGYKTLLVGACRGHILDNVIYDDWGDNISEKNENFCELTGMYWIWKNCSDEYKGIAHYRRFFCRSLNKTKMLTEKEILHKLQNHQMIVPFRRNLKMSVEKEYCNVSGFEKDLNEVRNIMEVLYPEYVEKYDEVMNGNTTFFFNMLIASSKVFNDYCEWLFSILFELEKRVDLNEYNEYQKRIYGFIAERLLTVYIDYNSIDTFEVGVVNTEETLPFPRNILSPIKRMVTYWKC